MNPLIHSLGFLHSALPMTPFASLEGFIGELIPITAIVTPFVFVLLILLIKAFREKSRHAARYEVIRAMIDKGVPIPPEMFRDGALADPEDHPDHDRKNGLVLIAVGVGLFLFFSFLWGDNPWMAKLCWVGAIPFLIGVATLFNYWLRKRDEKNDSAKK